MKTMIFSLLVALCCCFGSTQTSAQCGQVPLNCTACTTPVVVTVDICLPGFATPVAATVTYCNQTAPATGLIKNPCTTTCQYPLNDVTYIRSICLPSSVSIGTAAGQTTVEQIYQGLIQATDFCCGNILGLTITIPVCGVATNPCDPNGGQYRHMLALPTCVNVVNNCVVPCGGLCGRFCTYTRAYCYSGSGSAQICNTCLIPGCQIGTGTCNASCNFTVACTQIIGYTYTGCCP